MSNYLNDALDIADLERSLQNISEDDKRSIDSYSKQEILDEANWVLSLFHEGGTVSNEQLIGDWGAEEKRYAKKQVKLLEAYINKYSITDES